MLKLHYAKKEDEKYIEARRENGVVNQAPKWFFSCAKGGDYRGGCFVFNGNFYNNLDDFF